MAGAPPPGYGAPPPGYGQPPWGYGPPGYYVPPGYGPPAYYGYRPTNSKAGWALGLGIAAYFLCPLTSIAAIIIGGQAKEEIRRTGESGEGMATAGVVLGWIGCGLMFLGLAIFVIAVIAASNAPA